MKKIVIWVTTLTIMVMFSAPLLAEEPRKNEDWRQNYTAALKKAKAVQLPTGQPQAAAGLGYTPSEAVALQDAIGKAMENQKEKSERACECMKIAVDLEYNPYLVIKTIYETGGDLKIDQLCMCASEAGIMKAIIAKAAREAVSPLGKPVYAPDEIAQTSCFRGEEGLAYTPGEINLAAIPVDNLGSNNYVSNATP